MTPRTYFDESKLVKNLPEDIKNAPLIGECSDCSRTIYGKARRCWDCGGVVVRNRD